MTGLQIERQKWNGVVNQMREINPAVNTVIGTDDMARPLTERLAREFDLNHFCLELPLSETSPIRQNFHSRSWDVSRALMIVGLTEEDDLLTLVIRLKQGGRAEDSERRRMDIPLVMGLQILSEDLSTRLIFHGTRYKSITLTPLLL